MNISLVNPPFMPRFSREQRSPAVTKSGTFYYPMWLSYATGFLEKEGHNCQLIDAVADKLYAERLLEKIENHQPSLIVISTSTPSIYNDVKIAEKVKKSFPQAIIVLVGPHVSALPEKSLRLSSAIDAVAIGEYEIILKELAAAIQDKEKWHEIKGLAWRHNNGIHINPDHNPPHNLDILPFVSKIYKKYLNITNYRYSSCQHPVLTLVTSRGCNGQCIFCSYNQAFSNRFIRYRSPENIIEELKYIKEKLPQVKEIMFEDDTFTLNPKRVRQLCDLIIKNNIKITWSANARVNINLQALILMKRAGCRLLCVGFESGDREILKKIKKGITLEQSLDFMKNARKTKILVHGCFMFGHPGETKVTMEKTLELAKKINPDSAQFFPVMPYPGTELYSWARENDYLRTKNFREWLTEDGLHSCVISRPGMTDDDLVQFSNHARRSFYLRPGFLTSKLAQVIIHPSEFSRNLKAFLKLIKHL